MLQPLAFSLTQGVVPEEDIGQHGSYKLSWVWEHLQKKDNIVQQMCTNETVKSYLLIDRLTSSEKQINDATNPLFSKQHSMIPTSPSFLQGPGPCQPCPAPVTQHLGMHLPKTASGPIALSVPSPQVLPQKVHNSMFLLSSCLIPHFDNKYI